MHYALRTVTEPQVLGEPELHALRAAGFNNTTLLELCNTIGLFSMLCGLADATQVPIDTLE
jgi:alkylhydroperoxidase family enzyme